MRPGLLSEVVSIGYEIFLEGENIKLCYRKEGNPPEIVRQLINELRECREEVKNILSGNSIQEMKKSPVNQTEIWDDHMAEIVSWFLSATLPEMPFSISSYERVLKPAKYYAALRRDIEAGPKGPRARHGVLQHDLQRLKDYCERTRCNQ